MASDSRIDSVSVHVGSRGPLKKSRETAVPRKPSTTAEPERRRATHRKRGIESAVRPFGRGTGKRDAPHVLLPAAAPVRTARTRTHGTVGARVRSAMGPAAVAGATTDDATRASSAPSRRTTSVRTVAVSVARRLITGSNRWPTAAVLNN